MPPCRRPASTRSKRPTPFSPRSTRIGRRSRAYAPARRASSRRRWTSDCSRGASTPMWCQVGFRIDPRVIPGEGPAAVEAELRELIATSARHNPEIKVAVRQLLSAAPLRPTDRIVAAIQRRAKQILGVDAPVTGVPLYTDARHYAAAGIPIVLYGAGPRS